MSNSQESEMAIIRAGMDQDISEMCGFIAEKYANGIDIGEQVETVIAYIRAAGKPESQFIGTLIDIGFCRVLESIHERSKDEDDDMAHKKPKVDPREYPLRSTCRHCKDDLGPVRDEMKDECDVCRRELEDGIIPPGMTNSRPSRAPGPIDDFDESLAADMEDAFDD